MRRAARLRVRLTPSLVVTTEVPVETLVALVGVAAERGIPVEKLADLVLRAGIEAVAGKGRDAGGAE